MSLTENQIKILKAADQFSNWLYEGDFPNLKKELGELFKFGAIREYFRNEYGAWQVDLSGAGRYILNDIKSKEL